MARRKKKRSTHRAKTEPLPGLVWMLFGLAIGLSVAFAVYVRDRRPPQQTRTTATEPASVEKESPTKDKGGRFTFYDMLPRFEVVIPEREPDVQHDNTIAAIEEPGEYVLQAGSFKNFDDADRRKASLALLGLESHIQRVTIDSDTWHRVRLGPYDDLNDLNQARRLLHDATIEVLRIRVPADR